jgi:hypothetical protein
MFSKQAKGAQVGGPYRTPADVDGRRVRRSATRQGSPPKVAVLLISPDHDDRRQRHRRRRAADRRRGASGDVRVGRLTVGETGHVEGSVYAEAVEVRGRVVGAITAKQVRLYGTSYIDGDITHEQLAMETGAFFQGRSLKFQRPAPAAQPAPAPAPHPEQLALAKPAAG